MTEPHLNSATPNIMHIDLNSCFATVEQQAFPHLRGKPIVIAAYTTPRGCILAPSIEAKRLGIKVGMRVCEARQIYNEIIVRDPDPCLVRDVHEKMMRIFSEYSPVVIPKSIDEAIIDFNYSPLLINRLIDVAQDIKQRLRREIGEWISCNIGIATNRFLAKLAAALHKPDGLDIITYKNLKQVYASVKLTDLNGINVRYEARLNTYGIFTPLQFFETSEQILRYKIFKSIVGHYWYKRLRGWEVDNREFARKSYGQEYALGKKTADEQELQRIIMKLCEKMGRRLRKSGNIARGIHLGILYDDYSYWHKSKTFEEELFTTRELYTKALFLFQKRISYNIVRKISVCCFSLTPCNNSQLYLFNNLQKQRCLSQAIDTINDKYGEYIIVPANIIGMNDVIVDRIAFGSTTY